MTQNKTITDCEKLESLRKQLLAYRDARDWEQFHTPKNLATALTVEAAELAEIFQWLTPEQSLNPDPGIAEKARLEMADILAYLILIADKMDIDLFTALQDKLKINEEKYPADKVRGSAKKYNEYL